MARTTRTGIWQLPKVLSIVISRRPVCNVLIKAIIGGFLAWDAAAQNMPPPPPQAGAVSGAALYELSAGVRWSDNYARTVIADSGAMGTLGAVLDAVRTTGRLQFDTKADLDYLHYFRGSYNDEVLGKFVGAASYQVLPQSLRWVIEDHFGQITTDYFQAPGPQNRQYLNVFSTGPELRVRLADALAIRVSGRYGRDDYQTSLYSATHLKGDLAMERRPSEAALLSLGGGHERVDYLKDFAKPGNFAVNRYYAGYTLSGARSSIDLEGGYAESQGGLAQLRGFTGHVVLESKIGASSSVHASARRELTTVGSGSRATDYLPGATGFTLAAILTGSLYFTEAGDIGYTWRRPRTEFDVSAGQARETDHRDIRPDRDLTTAGAKLTHRLTPLADAIFYAGWSRDLLHDAQIPGRPIGDFLSTEIGYGATVKKRWSQVVVTSFDLAHTERTADIGRYRENAVWLRLAYSPRPPATSAP
jgi:hypothetical protein